MAEGRSSWSGPRPSGLSFDKAKEIYAGDDFEMWLHVRLVQIAGATETAAAIRAIELLLELPRTLGDDELSHLSLDEIANLDRQVDARLAASRKAGGTTRNGDE